jgi:hypothetical protein
MRESLDEPISVVFYFDSKINIVQPHRLSWNGRDYQLGKVDFHHKTRSGTTLIHHFSLANVEETAYFKIALDTTTLHWKLEEYMYGNDNNPSYGSENTYDR